MTELIEQFFLTCQGIQKKVRLNKVRARLSMIGNCYFLERTVFFLGYFDFKLKVITILQLPLE